MTDERDRGDPGHEPEQTNDEWFAPVLRDADARGRTVDGGREGAGEEATGTGTDVPDGDRAHPDALPPDTEGVRQAERRDASRPHD